MARGGNHNWGCKWYWLSNCDSFISQGETETCITKGVNYESCNQPIQRMGLPSEIAADFAFLAVKK